MAGALLLGNLLDSLCGGCCAALGGDQLAEPPDLAFYRFQAVPLKFEGVTVDPLPGAARGAATVQTRHGVGALFQATAPTFENPQPNCRVRPAEEREPDTETVVLPLLGTARAHQLGEVVLAVGGQGVDDFGAPTGQRRDRHAPGFLDDPARRPQRL